MAHPGGHGGQEVEKASVDRARHPRTQIARAAENTGRPDRPQAQADRRSNPPKGSDVERIPQLAPGQAQNPEVTNCATGRIDQPIYGLLGPPKFTPIEPTL